MPRTVVSAGKCVGRMKPARTGSAPAAGNVAGFLMERLDAALTRLVCAVSLEGAADKIKCAPRMIAVVRLAATPAATVTVVRMDCFALAMANASSRELARTPTRAPLAARPT